MTENPECCLQSIFQLLDTKGTILNLAFKTSNEISSLEFEPCHPIRVKDANLATNHKKDDITFLHKHKITFNLLLISGNYLSELQLV